MVGKQREQGEEGKGARDAKRQSERERDEQRGG